LPGLKYGIRLAGTSTLSPVFGFLPCRDRRWRIRKLPKPRSSILSSRCRAWMMESKTVLTMASECFLVSSETLATSSTRSALVISGSSSGPPVPRGPASPGRLILGRVLLVAAPTALLIARPATARVAGHLAEVDVRVSLCPHVGAVVLAVRLLRGGLDGQADLLLRDVHLDDLGGDSLVER